MPGREVCDQITDPIERQQCRNYQGKYAKQKPGAARPGGTSPAGAAPASPGIKKPGMRRY